VGRESATARDSEELFIRRSGGGDMRNFFGYGRKGGLYLDQNRGVARTGINKLLFRAPGQTFGTGRWLA